MYGRRHRVSHPSPSVFPVITGHITALRGTPSVQVNDFRRSALLRGHKVNRNQTRVHTLQSLALWTLAFWASLYLLGCKGEVQSSPAPPVPEIGVMTVTPTSVPDEPEFIGQAEASRIVEIRSQVTGIIQERYFQEGERSRRAIGSIESMKCHSAQRWPAARAACPSPRRAWCKPGKTWRA